MGDMNMLREKIKESGITVTAIADKLNVSRETLYNRMNGESEFRASEIAILTDTLRLKKSEQDTIFFNQ